MRLLCIRGKSWIMFIFSDWRLLSKAMSNKTTTKKNTENIGGIIMPTLLTIEFIVAFILFVFTIISVIDSVRSKKDPLMKQKISVQCPCCKSKNIRFQSIQVNRGKPFSIFPMLNFISFYFFSIVNFFYILSEEEEIKKAHKCPQINKNMIK